MKLKHLITAAVLMTTTYAAALPVSAQGDKNRHAENNPNQELPPVQNRNQTTDPNPSPSPDDNQYRYQQTQTPNSNERQIQTQNQGEETQNRVESGRTDVAGVHAARLQFRFENYYNKLSAIAGKLQKLITQYADQEKEMSAAQAKLDEAVNQMNQAQIQAVNAIAAYNDIDPAMYQYQRQLALQASEIAQQTHAAYKNSLKLMFEAVKQIRQALQSMVIKGSRSVLAGGDKVRGDESVGPSYQYGVTPFTG